MVFFSEVGKLYVVSEFGVFVVVVFVVLVFGVLVFVVLVFVVLVFVVLVFVVWVFGEIILFVVVGLLLLFL